VLFFVFIAILTRDSSQRQAEQSSEWVSEWIDSIGRMDFPPIETDAPETSTHVFQVNSLYHIRNILASSARTQAQHEVYMDSLKGLRVRWSASVHEVKDGGSSG
jgi:hypothetical protein